MHLLEREEELHELDLLLEEALGGGGGRLVLLEGPPGIGKTQLVDALRGRARERGVNVLSARASELDRDFPFGVVRQLFEPLVAAARTHPGNGRPAAGLLDGAAALARPLFEAAPAAAPPPDRAGREGPAVELFHGLYWLTANLADQGPLLLAIDDVHWADPASLQFLQFLVPRLEELPVVVALASRIAEPGFDREPIDALATDPLARVLRPSALGATAVAALISNELGAAPDPLFTAACSDATGGNPFLLRELLRELASDGVAPAADAVPLVRQLAPPTVARAVLLRLARLGEDAAALARAIAVLGDAAPLRRVAALAKLSEERAAEAAAALATAGILDADASLCFAHPILRAAVYGEIGQVQRSRAHRRAADLLASEGAEASAIAVQLLATEPSADAHVVATLEEAAAQARSRGAAAAAAAFLRRAIDEPPAPAARAELLFALASAELDAGNAAPAADHFEQAARATPDPRRRAEHVWEHAVALQTLGRHEDAYALRERAAAEVGEIDRDLGMQIEAGLIASAGLDLSRSEWARGRLDSYRGRLTGATPAEQRLLATQAYYDAMYGDAPAEEIADVAERALLSGTLVDNHTGFASTAFFSAIEALWLADRTDAARRALDAKVDQAQRRGSPLGFACLVGWRCMLHARSGELAEAEADARRCAELNVSHGLFVMAPPMLGYVLTVYVERGLLDEAALLLERVGAATRPAGDDIALFPMLHARARLRAARGDVEGGRADMAELARRRARWNSDLTVVPALLFAPELDDGGLDVGRMRADAESWGTPRAIGMALRAEALAGGAGAERTIELLEQAVDTLAESPARLEHARALADLGATLRRRGGHVGEARATLREALDAADARGASLLADRARAELRAAGARPRRPRISGVEALTPSERRIASMAADGLSNPEIAQALFVTKKTVEAHLGSAYRKLDINSRAQLAGALAGPVATTSRSL
jgi:DNA-binding CsgD family transcriptional regulator